MIRGYTNLSDSFRGSDYQTHYITRMEKIGHLTDLKPLLNPAVVSSPPSMSTPTQINEEYDIIIAGGVSSTPSLPGALLLHMTDREDVL